MSVRYKIADGWEGVNSKLPYKDPAKRRAHHKEYYRRWRKKNPDKGREYGRRWRKKNPDKVREEGRRHLRWVKENPDKIHKYGQRWRKRLANGYVAATLGLKISQCPKILIETKRIQLMLHRAAKGVQGESSKHDD